MSSEAARQQAQAGTLLVADNKTGYAGVTLVKPGSPKPFQARVRRGGKEVSLGYFATAEEAALRVARSPEGQAAAVRAAATAPLTSEEVRQQAQAEELSLILADNKTGYFGVHRKRGRKRPYQARVKRAGKEVNLGYFATAEEAALSVSRTPEGHAAAERVAAALSTYETSEEAWQFKEIMEAVVSDQVSEGGGRADAAADRGPQDELLSLLSSATVYLEPEGSDGRPKRRRG